MRVDLRRLILVALLGMLFASIAAADGPKSVNGKITKITGKVLTIEKTGLFSKSTGVVNIEMDDATKVSGQLVAGMRVKIKYREEGSRKFALTIDAAPDYASKEAKEAAKHTKP